MAANGEAFRKCDVAAVRFSGGSVEARHNLSFLEVAALKGTCRLWKRNTGRPLVQPPATDELSSLDINKPSFCLCIGANPILVDWPKIEDALHLAHLSTRV